MHHRAYLADWVYAPCRRSGLDATRLLYPTIVTAWLTLTLSMCGAFLWALEKLTASEQQTRSAVWTRLPLWQSELAILGAPNHVVSSPAPPHNHSFGRS